MKVFVSILFSFFSIALFAQERKYSELLSATAMKIWPDSFALPTDKTAKWRYDQGVVLKGIEGVWNSTGNGDWFRYMQKSMDFYINEDGTIKGYRPDEYNIDHINNGKILLTLYRVTGNQKYKKAIDLLRSQLLTHPRTSEGGFWHKKIYPSQMWLDGLYMGQPFYAEYAMVFHEDSIFNDVARQFILMERHARNQKTGLLYHGWDETKEQKWANKKTGLSPHVWARALGWYGMAMVDALDYFPAKHPGRDSIIAILNRYAKAVTKVQDMKSGVWYDIADMPTAPKNYKEASASCMITYALAKAIRLQYIPASYRANTKKAYEGILREFIKTEDGQVNLHGTVAVSGLGGNPYRDGSFDYYMSEPVIVNDPKGMGAFIQCAVEMENRSLQLYEKRTVLLDRYFNSEKRKDATGKEVYWHYTWEERSHPGFSMLGELFKRHGVTLDQLDVAPTAENLKSANIYIIVDPDHVKDNPRPNYVSEKDVDVIVDWVKKGGVLLLMANDSANCDLEHFNLLASRFGIQFTNKSRNMVKNDEFSVGEVDISPLAFGSLKRKAYLKEISVLAIKKPAVAIANKDSDVIIAQAVLGKGTVLAVGDPWIYNEYIDGRKVLPGFNNYQAAADLVNHLYMRVGKWKK